MEKYKNYIADDKAAPDTVNPSLWRNAQLNMQYGLFKVVPTASTRCAAMTCRTSRSSRATRAGSSSTPLISPETAKAALDLANQKLGQRPVVAVVHSHSHVDHYGGVRGIVNQADVDSGKVKIIAPGQLRRGRGQRERHRRQRDEPPRGLHVRCAAAAQRRRAA